MAKKTVNVEDIIDNETIELKEIPSKPVAKPKRTREAEDNFEGEYINCLRKEIITVRHINKQTGNIRDPKHVLYGGMAENATRTFTVPLLRSGALADVLTKDEKKFLEYYMGLEPNALSVYRKEDNFWDTANDEGISKVILHKHDTHLDLSVPEDYIKYKILLANKERIAPSIKELQDRPKATYEYVLLSDKEDTAAIKTSISTKMQCYKELGKIEDNIDILRLVIETIDGRGMAPDSKIEILQNKANDLIQANAKLFLNTVTDKLLPTKVLIKKAIESGIISKRGDYFYMRKDGMPLCGDNQEPTFNIAATFLNEPRNQELKFSIEAQLKD